MTRDIQDLFALAKMETGPTTGGSNFGADAMKLLSDLENELALKQSKIDHENSYKELLDKISSMQDKLETLGEPVQAEDILRWNDNVHKTRDNDDQIEKIKKQLS